MLVQHIHFSDQSLLLLPFTICIVVGYISTVDSTSMVGANQRIIEEQAARKKEEYLHNEELAQMAKLFESNEVI